MTLAKESNEEKGERCFLCQRKLPLTTFACKCKHFFCQIHRYPEDHQCSYDFKMEHRMHLEKICVAVKKEKISKIM